MAKFFRIYIKREIGTPPKEAVAQVLYLDTKHPEWGMLCYKLENGSLVTADLLEPWTPDETWQLKQEYPL